MSSGLAVAIVAGGCALDGDRSAVPSTAVSSRQSAESGDGISADEARSQGVFTGPYDAELIAVGPQPGPPAQAVLRNLGHRPDSYRITVDPPGAARLDRVRATLRPGATATIGIEVLTTPFVIRVLSRGRGGADIADLTVPDAAP